MDTGPSMRACAPAIRPRRSYADVMDSAKGWAGTIRFNDKLWAQFQDFYARPDTFSLGVCNGCQVRSCGVGYGLSWEAWAGQPGSAAAGGGGASECAVRAAIAGPCHGALLSSRPRSARHPAPSRPPQLMALLGWVPATGAAEPAGHLADAEQPRFVHNASGRFESRWTMVRIEDGSPAIMLKVRWVVEWFVPACAARCLFLRCPPGWHASCCWPGAMQWCALAEHSMPAAVPLYSCAPSRCCCVPAHRRTWAARRLACGARTARAAHTSPRMRSSSAC